MYYYVLKYIITYSFVIHTVNILSFGDIHDEIKSWVFAGQNLVTNATLMPSENNNRKPRVQW